MYISHEWHITDRVTLITVRNTADVRKFFLVVDGRRASGLFLTVGAALKKAETLVPGSTKVEVRS